MHSFMNLSNYTYSLSLNIMDIHFNLYNIMSSLMLSYILFSLLHMLTLDILYMPVLYIHLVPISTLNLYMSLALHSFMKLLAELHSMIHSDMLMLLLYMKLDTSLYLMLMMYMYFHVLLHYIITLMDNFSDMLLHVWFNNILIINMYINLHSLNMNL